MKKAFYVIICVIILMIIITMVFIYRDSRTKGIKVIEADEPKYHFSAILDNQSTGFTDEVIRGIVDASAEFNVVVEIHKAGKMSRKDDVYKYLDMAVLSKVDGIILNAKNYTEMLPLIHTTYENIPLITIETDSALMGKRISFIGTSSFEVGRKVGEFIRSFKLKKVKIAIILPDTAGSENRFKNLLLSGLRDVVENDSEVEIEAIMESKPGSLDAKEVTVSLLKKYPDINLIFCTTIDNTLGTVQELIDLNRIADVNVIGYDISADIIRYIERGLILGSVYRNPYKMGYESVKKLYNVREKKGEPAYTDIATEIVTKENIKKYKIY